MLSKLSQKRVTAKTVLQYEAAECGAASLATILKFFGKNVELSELRKDCGINRDGSNAKDLLIAARKYGLKTKAYRCSGEQLKLDGRFPCIIFWGFNHFLLVEGFDKDHVFLSDPAQGRVRVLMEEFLDQFTGIVLELEPGEEFKTGGITDSPLLEFLGTLKPYKISLIQLGIISTCQAVIALLVSGFTSTFIDSFLQNQRLYLGIPIIWLFLITIIGWLTLLMIQYLLLRRIELLLSKKLTADLFRKLFKVTYGFYQARFQGEIASRMLLGLETTQVIVSRLIRFFVGLWTGIIILLFAFVISGWLSAFVLIIMIGNLLLNWWLTELRYDDNRKLAIEQGKAHGKGLQGINNIETIKASGLEFDFLSQWQGYFGNVVIQNQKLGTQMAFSSIAASGSIFMLNALIIAIGGLLIISGKISLGVLVAFQFLQGQLIEPISSLPQISSILQRLIGDLGRLQDLRKNNDDPYVQSFNQINVPVQNNDSNARLTGLIKLKNLSFSFNTTSEPFINNINLEISKGTMLSIVGNSGSGKTTLIRLLAGLYQPTSGQLLFDDKDWIANGDTLMRNSLAYVPQQVFIFNATVEDNITLWRPRYEIQALENAARDAQILETICSHPEAFQRQLSDNGSDLSGGERQRLEISRALLREPSILLFDESTSALDNATQSLILDSLKVRGITLINVAHRLDSALRSDQVLVMDSGSIIEKGTPNELIKNEGFFYRLLQKERPQSLVEKNK